MKKLAICWYLDDKKRLKRYWKTKKVNFKGKKRFVFNEKALRFLHNLSRYHNFINFFFSFINKKSNDGHWTRSFHILGLVKCDIPHEIFMKMRYYFIFTEFLPEHSYYSDIGLSSSNCLSFSFRFSHECFMVFLTSFPISS